MTPTLSGRWQIRFFLLGTVGLIISLLVSLIIHSSIPMFALLYVFLFGLLWDILYQFITSFRWDRDWPTSFQVAAGIIEGAFVWGLILTGTLPGIPVVPPFYVYLIQYGAIWLVIFMLTQGPLRIFFLKWRYQGGQWLISRGSQGSEKAIQQPVAVPPAGGNFIPQATPIPQAAPNNLQYPVPPAQPISGSYYQYQQPAAPPQVVHPGYANNQPYQGVLHVQQQPSPLACVCGFVFGNVQSNFCPRCGRGRAAPQGV